MSRRRIAQYLAVLSAVACSAGLHSAQARDELGNDGTDPTKPVRKAQVDFEHLALTSGFQSDVWTFTYVRPIGEGRETFQLKVPIFSTDLLGNDDYGLGDISLQYANVLTVTPDHGVVIQAELFLDTAERPELGTGKYYFKPTIIYAEFLKSGILAPSLVHSLSFAGDSKRADVNVTTFDLYFVPTLSNPSFFMTFDPSITYDWERELLFAGLAITLGYKLGPMMGGNGQIILKPSATFGSDRPVDWGIKVGFQLLNF